VSDAACVRAYVAAVRQCGTGCPLSNGPSAEPSHCAGTGWPRASAIVGKMSMFSVKCVSSVPGYTHGELCCTHCARRTVRQQRVVKPCRPMVPGKVQRSPGYDGDIALGCFLFSSMAIETIGCLVCVCCFVVGEEWRACRAGPGSTGPAQSRGCGSCARRSRASHASLPPGTSAR
jgi:hypothetical protein